MRGWMNDERVMIACCSDGTRPVIFKIERLDYKVLYMEGAGQEDCQNSVRQALEAVDGVTEVAFREEYAEVYLQSEIKDRVLEEAVKKCGECKITKID